MRSGKTKPTPAVSRRSLAGYYTRQLLCSSVLALILALFSAPLSIAERTCAECIALAELSCRAGCDSPNSRAVILKCARDCAEERCKDVCDAENPDGENTREPAEPAREPQQGETQKIDLNIEKAKQPSAAIE